MVASSRKLAFASCLLTCPLLLVAAVLVLPRLNLYGTPAEGYVLFALMALPLAGAASIVRYKQSTLLTRLLLATGYLIAGLVFALFGVIFIGCSWAGACF